MCLGRGLSFPQSGVGEISCPGELGPPQGPEEYVALASFPLSGFQVRKYVGGGSAPVYSVPGSEPSPGPLGPASFPWTRPSHLWETGFKLSQAWAPSPRWGFCVVWEGQRTPLVNRAEITWCVFLAGTQQYDAGPGSAAGTTEPQKCASNYSVDVAARTQAFYRIQ